MNISTIRNVTIPGLYTDRTALSKSASPTDTERSATPSIVDLRREYRAIADFRDIVRDFRAKLGPVAFGRTGTSLKTITSAAALGLGSTPTYTRVASTGELNTLTTEFSPEQPAFSGNSTAVPTVSGVYNGVIDDVLTFRIQQPGQLSSNSDKPIDVTDQNGAFVETIVVPGAYVSGTAIALSNGLEVAFSDGSFSNNDTFQVSVFANVDVTIESANPLNGTGASSPNFEPGVSVTAGEFSINGEPITVVADDSVNSVLAKITASAAGVSASYDADTELVTLTSTTAGSAGQITFGADTSGFLSAVRLDGATVTAGTDDDLTRKISDVVALSSISSGTFLIDSTEFTEDTSTDTLQDVLDQINAAATGVTFEYDQSSDIVRMTPDGSLRQIELDDGTSGFFSGVNITTGTRSLISRNSRGSGEINRIVKLVTEFAADLNKLVETADSDSLRQAIGLTISNSVKNSNTSGETNIARLLQGFGLTFDTTGKSDLLTVDEGQLATALRSRGNLFVGLFARGKGTSSSQGVLFDLDDALGRRQRAIQDYIINQGRSVIDLLA